MSKQISPKGQKTRVKIVAIAKDEAAYIPEWVHHHLYHGFDAIDVYINRTTDNSMGVLDCIHQRYPQVRGRSADWIDLCPVDAQNCLQYIVYASALDEARQSGEFDYLLFLDIDEFWTPKSLKLSIQDVITANADADTISFEWINAFGQKQAFSPLPQRIKGKINPLVKTLVKLTANVSRVGYHFPELRNGKSVMADGDTFRADPNLREGLHPDLQHLRPVMVIHRLFRSPMEYVSLLHRGRPSDELQLKLNRGGYNVAIGREVCFELNKKNYAEYDVHRRQFIEELDIQQELEVGREFVQQRYHKTLAHVQTVPRKYFPDLFRVFRGCTRAEYQALTDAIINSKKLQRCKDADELIELAKEIEKSDVKVAYHVWLLASELRPRGPLIRKRVAEYAALDLQAGIRRSDLFGQQAE
ncbi:glycosyltransferase family 2 protein [Lacimicrobium alkaliphilum]|uniref:Glycosyl transferase family 2 n=1 Tax=Lacimicrobium alkaliphilum TaxID=1526571 RepID=A0ABQ1R7H0_9ALTE|nr:glycosyltransferase family 2 protein [Lacimicrobium alkaliphilum]GGD57457.1 hypothetical protein GCM10011357_11090 [Lacimicrobium alkaliphilum]